MTSAYKVITTRGSFQLVAHNSAHAISSALELAGAGAALIRCTRLADW